MKIKIYICVFICIVMLTICTAAADMGHADELRGILITSVPENGTLTCGGRILTRGSAVPASMLENISGGEFSYIPVYGSGNTGEVCTVSAEVNVPPQAMDFSVTTYKNAAVEGRLRAYDEDGDELCCEIITSPKKGTVTVEGNNFVYRPYLNKKGEDRFEYRVCDADGEWSENAMVKVNIERKNGISYADTEGESFEYAALRLSEEGIYTGQCLAGKYYFNGDNYVNRGEFMAMAVMAAGCEGENVSTVFADDAEITSDIRPYINGAVECGAISGSIEADGVYLRPNEIITRAEAAVIADNMLRTSGGEREFTEMPAWAAQAVSDLDACGIIVSDDDEKLTMAEAAQLIVDMMNYRSRSGLFSWTAA